MVKVMESEMGVIVKVMESEMGGGGGRDASAPSYRWRGTRSRCHQCSSSSGTKRENCWRKINSET